MQEPTNGMDRDNSSSEPLHAQIAARLRREVRDARYAPGQRLPSEVELARLLGVSRGTVRQALATLLGDGLLETIPGRGTFVSDGQLRQAGLIGMILPSVVRARNPELIGGAEETFRRAGYSMILGISGDERWLETEQLQRIVGQGASGAIVYTVDGPRDGPLEVPALRRLVERGFPLVLIDRYIPDLPVDAVTMDNIGGGFLAVQHLATLGFRRIGYIGTDNVGTSSILERMSGYRWALGQYGLDYQADLVCADVRRLLSWPPSEPDKQRHNEAVLREFLGRPGRPEAAFVCSDYVAFQVVQVAGSMGLRIPEDLALVGFDNVANTDYFGVPLTTIEQPRHEIGTTAARLLLDRIAGRRTQPGRVVIGTRLVVRRSSAPQGIGVGVGAAALEVGVGAAHTGLGAGAPESGVAGGAAQSGLAVGAAQGRVGVGAAESGPGVQAVQSGLADGAGQSGLAVAGGAAQSGLGAAASQRGASKLDRRLTNPVQTH